MNPESSLNKLDHKSDSDVLTPGEKVENAILKSKVPIRIGVKIAVNTMIIPAGGIELPVADGIGALGDAVEAIGLAETLAPITEVLEPVIGFVDAVNSCIPDNVKILNPYIYIYRQRHRFRNRSDSSWHSDFS